MALPTWRLTGRVLDPAGQAVVATLTLRPVPAVVHDPAGGDVTASVVRLTTRVSGDPVLAGTELPADLVAADGLHFVLSVEPRLWPAVTFAAPSAGSSLALDDIVPSVPTPIATVDAATLRAEWQAAITAIEPGGVTSVAGRSGAVVLTKSDVGLSSVDNTADADKPVSTATATALAGKAASSHTHTSGDVSDSTTVGRAVLAAADAASARAAIAAVSDTDARLSDARTPLAHTQAISTVTGLQTALDGKAATGHAHALDDLSDVDVTSATTGQVLTKTAGGWGAATPSGGGASQTSWAWPAPDATPRWLLPGVPEGAANPTDTFGHYGWLYAPPVNVTAVGLSVSLRAAAAGGVYSLAIFEIVGDQAVSVVTSTTVDTSTIGVKEATISAPLLAGHCYAITGATVVAAGGYVYSLSQMWPVTPASTTNPLGNRNNGGVRIAVDGANPTVGSPVTLIPLTNAAAIALKVVAS